MENYPAFSGLKGASIGIGLEYFNGSEANQANTMAYVQTDTSLPTNGALSASYTISVNIDSIDPAQWEQGDREELEAVIAHEMIHAFMDETAASGMLGRPGQAGGEGFPSWFVEGMSQTASGPDNWISAGL